MQHQMQHWNGNQLCAIDIETTGTDPTYHEIIQIAIIALDGNIDPMKTVLPFYIDIAPENPERFERDAMRVNKMKLAQIALRGHDREKAADLLIQWVEKLNLPYTKWGTRKRIIPLGHNYAQFDSLFIKRWLGPDRYGEYFDPRCRDTMQSAIYMNDRADMHNEPIPYAKVNLQWLASRLRVETDRAHDALQDCLTTAKVYKALLKIGLFA
jgi:DNA polymerase III epsilon subunit-like protein